jgi:hypothetical protein
VDTAAQGSTPEASIDSPENRHTAWLHAGMDETVAPAASAE